MSDKEKPVPLTGTVQIPIKYKVNGAEVEKNFIVEVSAPGPKAELETLTKALEQNRQLLGECQDDIYLNMKKDFYDYQPPWELNYDGPIQTAVMARHNINLLIPLVNIRGGKAKYSKIEAMPVKNHVEKILFKAEKAALEWQVEKSAPMMYAFVAAAIVAVAVITFVSIR